MFNRLHRNLRKNPIGRLNGDSNIQTISPSVFNVSSHLPANSPKSLLYPQSRTGPQPATAETPVPTQSQIEANRHTPQNTTGPASVISTAVSSLNTPKTGAQVTIPPSPRNRTADPPVCDTKSSPMSATHSRKMAYPHTRNTHGFRVLRHNAPAPAAPRPVDHARNPLLGQRDKAARHLDATAFTGTTGGAGPETASLEETQPLTPPIGFVPPIVSASPPHTRTERPRGACTPATQPGTPLMRTVAVNVPLGHYPIPASRLALG
jgi:hypothetical protein